MLKKSVKWEEPLKSAVLREFSEENITVIIIEILKDYLTEEEAKSLADFLESYEGQKLVAYAYGEYDLTKMPETEWKKMERFMKTKAGVAFNNFADLGMEKYHQTLRERTKKLVDSHRK